MQFSYLIFVLNCITGSDENYASHCSELSGLHQQPFDAVVCPNFIRKLWCYLYIHTDFWSKFCILYWMAPCWLWQAVWGVIFKICVIFGVQFERRKADKNANLHENWSMQTLLWSILNISAKCRQNRSLQFRGIPLQSLCVFFWDTV